MFRSFKFFLNRCFFSAFLFLFFGLDSATFAQLPGGLNIDLNSFTSPDGFSSSVGLLVLMSLITLAPFFLMVTTSFLRIVVVFSLLRQALATQQSPPNGALIGLAIFMTIFIMTPSINKVIDTSVKPYQEGVITQKEALANAAAPFREFMLKFASENDLALFLEFSKIQYTSNYDEIPIFVIIPAFVLSELKAAFQISFLLFIPFLVIDLIISNVLLSLGMMMLSPAMISMPFKLLLFVLTDGWFLLTQGLLLSFQ